MKGIEIRDFLGDYALDIPMGEGCVHTIYFNSYRNAKTVKRIMEVDDSNPNAATVCDMVEVVRCKYCKHCLSYIKWNQKNYFGCCRNGEIYEVEGEHFCSYGERKEQSGV